MAKNKTPDPQYNPDRLKGPRNWPERSRYESKTDAEVAEDLKRRFESGKKDR
jgi:hypothetical protein